MDELDKDILRGLAANAKIPLKELAAQVGLSAPSVGERIKRLEEKGQIGGYTIQADLKKLGYECTALVRINPLPGKLRVVERLIADMPEVIECDKVTGEDCFVARLCLRSLEELDRALEGLHDHAQTVTSIVKSQSVARRLPPL